LYGVKVDSELGMDFPDPSPFRELIHPDLREHPTELSLFGTAFRLLTTSRKQTHCILCIQMPCCGSKWKFYPKLV